MNNKLIIWLMAIGLFSGCSDEEEKPENNKEEKPAEKIEVVKIELTTDEKEVCADANDFSYKFFKQISAEEADSNIFVSPLSVQMAFAMVANGANGNTLNELQTALGFDTARTDTLNNYCRKMITQLPTLDKSTKIDIANSIWVDEQMPLNEDFAETNRTIFDAEISNVDMGGKATLNLINDWCNVKTNGCIPRIINELKKECKVILANALYFKGLWTKVFSEENTKDEEFSNFDGSKSAVPMMQQEEEFAYGETSDYQIATLPYGNGSFVMDIILPKEGISLNNCISGLSKDKMKDVYDQMTKEQLNLKLPRFELESSKELIETMRNMGVNDAFVSGVADFSRISASPLLYIGEALQRAYIKVNEEGTEAAAVTVIEVVNDALPAPKNTILFHVNRPFALTIRETSTGAVLFMGKIVKL